MMQKANLHFPRLVSFDTSRLSPKPKALKSWLNDLPLGDMEASAMHVLKALREYNRCKMTPALRLETLNIYGRVVQELTSGLVAKYRDSTFPFSERNRERCMLVNQLFEEMAHGFKWLVNDYFESWEQRSAPQKEFFDVTRISIVYLSKRMVSAYSTYSLEPDGVWHDLHQLYKLTDHFQLQGQVDHSVKIEKSIGDTIHAYLRIVMLSITNPYHLMQGEAQLIYNYLNKWVDGCRIVPVTGYIIDKGDLIIDLDHDLPPQFIFQDHLTQPKNCKTVDMSQLMDRFKETIAALTTRKELAGGLENSNLSFNERIRRDMLYRLQTVWNDRLERGAKRKSVSSKVRLVSSLCSSHYFIDEQNEFYPESDEIRFHKPQRKDEERSSGLSLMPADYEPWKDEQERHKVDAELETNRLSLFDADLDVWEKIFASKSHARALHEIHATQYKDHLWQQLNVSHKGMGVRYNASENARVSVGNIIAYHPEHDENEWCVGVVTWMKEYSSNHLDMGIKILPGVPSAVALRAISGAGCGSEYFRGILLTTEQSGKSVTNIIVPASMYDVGTQLVLNFRDELKYIRLCDIKRTTTCYSMFSFQDIVVPMIEQAKIKEIKSA
jgi:cyclic-di-GMP-binding protein